MWIIQSKYGEKNFYEQLEKELHSLIQGESNLIANLANISSWIYHAIPGLNWSGFYLWSDKDQELILGPFQGMPACIRIKAERGVCGQAYRERKTLNVADVHEFPGHIACDSASRSELVIPLIKDQLCIGVLDLDAPSLARFSQQDAEELTRIMNDLSSRIF